MAEQQLTREYTVGIVRGLGRSAEFVVHTTYCDGHDESHIHHLIEDAAGEYVSALVTAIEPPPTQRLKLSANTDQVGEVPKHVRQVTLLVYDDDSRLIHHLDSGVFVCEHKPE